MPAASEKQAIAARIAGAVKKREVPAEPGQPSTQMAKMPMKSLKKFMKTKKGKKEEGVLDEVFAVITPSSGCKPDSLVKRFDPLQGLPADQVDPSQVQGVYHEETQAQAKANELYEAYCQQEKMLEEKKYKITEKIKAVMKRLEKERAQCNELIRENPKDSLKEKERVAHLTHTLDELVTKLERVHKSMKPVEEAKDKTDKKEE